MADRKVVFGEVQGVRYRYDETKGPELKREDLARMPQKKLARTSVADKHGLAFLNVVPRRLAGNEDGWVSEGEVARAANKGLSEKSYRTFMKLASEARWLGRAQLDVHSNGIDRRAMLDYRVRDWGKLDKASLGDAAVGKLLKLIDKGEPEFKFGSADLDADFTFRRAASGRYDVVAMEMDP